MPKPDPKYFLWLDMETTGLDHREDQPLEIAALVTTPDLQEVEGCPRFHSLIDIGLHARARIAESEYVLDMHTRNGLIQEIADQDAPCVDEVEVELFKFIGEHAPEPPIFLAGTGVAAFDKPVLAHWFPIVDALLDYRTIDVGHMRRFLKHVIGWTDEQMPAEADDEHRARGDVMNALQQARDLRLLLDTCNPANGYHSNPHKRCLLR